MYCRDGRLKGVMAGRTPSRRAFRRKESIALKRPTETSQAREFEGARSLGHCRNAAANAACIASSARSKSPSIRINVANTRRDAERNTASMVSWTFRWIIRHQCLSRDADRHVMLEQKRRIRTCFRRLLRTGSSRCRLSRRIDLAQPIWRPVYYDTHEGRAG